MSGEVIACHTVEEWNEKLATANESKKLIVINFTATWCPPIVGPMFADIANRYVYVVFLKVDVEELNSVAQEFEIKAVPTYFFMKEGKIVDKVVGANKDKIIAILEKRKPVVAAA